MKKEKNGLLFNLLLLTIFFNVWFPKAGIKFSGIPLTLGNVFFAITFILWILNKIKTKQWVINKIGYIILLSFPYFILKYLYILGIVTDYKKYIIYNINYIIPLIIYPLIYFLIVDIVNSEQKMKKVMNILIYGVLFLSFYSILQFFVGIQNCDIPGLTVNISDYKEYGPLWFMQKSNGIEIENTKIVSTYQNGNLFGINMLLIFPIVYSYLERRKKGMLSTISLILFIISVFLSLSRACWLGIILFIIFGILFEKEKSKQELLNKLFLLFMCVISIVLIFKYMPSVSNRFFDTKSSDWLSMSGRTEGLIEIIKVLKKSGSILAWIVGPYGIVDYTAIAYEMLPVSIFAQTGIIGLFLIYLIFFKCIKFLKSDNEIVKSVKLSIVMWLITGCIESGYWLPPTALNIYMLIGIGLVSKKEGE